MKRELKTLLKDLWPHRYTVAIVAVTGIIMSLAQGRIAFEIKTMFDGLEAKDADVMRQAPLVILGLTVIAAVCRYFHLYLMDVASDRLTVDLRKRLQEKFMTLSMSFHSQFKSGSGGLISRILNDIVEIQFGLRLVADFFREPVLFVYLVGTLLYFNWQLTLALLLILPPLVVFLGNIGRSLRKYGHKSQEVMEQLTNTIKESLDGVRTIQSFNLEDEMKRRFDVEAEQFIEHRKKIHSRTQISGPLTETLATVVVIAIFTYLGMKIVAGESTFGDFVGYLAALLMLQKPIKKMQESFVKVQQTLVSVQRVYDILDSDSAVSDPENPEVFPEDWKTIDFDNVTFAYGDQEPVLRGVSLQVNRGEVIAFVGVSGSGKTTLVNLLARFFDPVSGTIRIDGIDIRNFKIADLRHHIALVSQDVFLFRDSIRRNIQAGDLALNGNVEAAAASANASPFIEKLPEGFETSVGDRGNLLSGGEKQRISIARAIYKDAPILMLDEATSALDSASEADVQSGLEHLMEGRTVFVVAHRLSTVINANRIIVLKQGKIAEQGTHHELLEAKGEYHRFYEIQTQ